MYRVLLPLDSDEDRSLAQAAYVTSLPDSADSVEALLLYVFTGDTEARPEDFETRRDATRVGGVRRAREHLESAGVEVSILEESGEPDERILEEAEANDVDAIVLGSEKRSPAGKALFGSVAQSVILHSDRPVVVTEPGGD